MVEPVIIATAIITLAAVVAVEIVVFRKRKEKQKNSDKLI